MSMIMILEGVSAEAAIELEEAAAISNQSSGVWGSHVLFDADDDENSISLEKAWHGLHFLLTGEPWRKRSIPSTPPS